ncbi:MAG: tetratricopeptide repeat protein, partial [Bacteroidetes bacterium]|nr:tetratricopeptide repeat protein [Fibrella sp.]
MPTRFLLLIGLLIPTALLRAQPSPEDALRAGLVAHPQADTARVDQLIRLADVVRPNNYVEALELGQEALLLSRKINYPAGEANALLAVGSAYGERNDYASALRYLNQARQRFDQQRDRAGMADVTGQIGWISTQQGEYVSALSFGLQSLDLAEALRDSSLIRRQIAMLGALYTLLGDYTQALTYYTSALEQYEQAHREAGVCKVLNGIGEVYRYQGDMPRAIRYYKKAIRLARALNNTRLEAETQSNLAAAYVQQYQYGQGLFIGLLALRVMLAKGQY